MICDPVFMIGGMKTSEIRGRTTIQYGNNFMSQWKVYEYVRRFKEGETSFVADVHSGQSSTVTCAKYNEHIKQHVWDNESVSIFEISSDISIIRGKKWCKNGLMPYQNIILSWSRVTCDCLDQLH